MLKLFSIISALFILPLILMHSAFAAGEEQKMQVKGPINITSETLTSDNKAHTALFEGKVVAKTTDMTIYSDKMLVFYTEGSGDVTKIEAMGNVRLLKSGRLITSRMATYYADEDKVVFTGDPRAEDGENVVTGETMTYYIAQERSYVENSKVFLKNKKDK
jgi:lipopolysaccharide export system protein LptA